MKTDNSQNDLTTLAQLNTDYLASDQFMNIERYTEILADDFMAMLPDNVLRNKTQFLEMIAAGRPFTDLKNDDVRIRLLGDFAIIHAHITFKVDGVEREGRYTDDWQRRDGRWVCVAANVVWKRLDGNI